MTRVQSERGHRLVEAAALVAVPLAMAVCALLDVEQTAGLTLLVVCLSLLLMFGSLERRRLRLRQLMPTTVLAALAAAGRILFAPIPDVKPVSAICIVAGATLGPASGFATGALAALVSNMFFGQGAWTPWQMYAWGLVGYLSGVFARHGWLGRRGAACAWGFVSALLYGLILNGWYVLGFVRPLTWQGVLLAYAAGLPLDVMHGAATVGFLLLIWGPWRRSLERVVVKYGLA